MCAWAGANARCIQGEWEDAPRAARELLHPSLCAQYLPAARAQCLPGVSLAFPSLSWPHPAGKRRHVVHRMGMAVRVLVGLRIGKWQVPLSRPALGRFETINHPYSSATCTAYA